VALATPGAAIFPNVWASLLKASSGAVKNTTMDLLTSKFIVCSGMSGTSVDVINSTFQKERKTIWNILLKENTDFFIKKFCCTDNFLLLIVQN
jgi:hypothetical protein